MITYALSIWAVAVVGGYLPYVVGVLGNGKDGASGSPWLSVLNVLSGGVFVAAGFMHLLPEAEEGLAALSSEWKFQFAPFFASLSFILMFLLEEAVAHISSSFRPYSSCNQGYDNENQHQERQQHRHDHLPSACVDASVSNDNNNNNNIDSNSNNHNHHHNHHHHHHGGIFFNNNSVGSPTAAGSAPQYSRGFAFRGSGGGRGFGGGSGGGGSNLGSSYTVDENYHLHGSGSDSGFPSPVNQEQWVGPGLVVMPQRSPPGLRPTLSAGSLRGGEVFGVGAAGAAGAAGAKEHHCLLLRRPVLLLLPRPLLRLRHEVVVVVRVGVVRAVVAESVMKVQVVAGL
ncbi:unnamed protein product [Pylaiella littoralis]